MRWNILIVLLAVVAGCVVIPPEMRGPRYAEKVFVRLGDGRPDARVVPGEPIRLRVYATDINGVVYHTDNGSLGHGRIQIETENMTFDPDAFTVTPKELTGEDLAQAEYAVIATIDGGDIQPSSRRSSRRGAAVDHTDHANNADTDEQAEARQQGASRDPLAGVSTRQTFAVDLGAYLGPAPTKVQTLQIAYGGEAKPDYLRPGHPIELDVTVTDVAGRRYVVGSTNKRIPDLAIERLNVETTLVEWAPDSRLLIPELDEMNVGANLYQVRVSYQTRPGEAEPAQPLVVERMFIPDFIGLHGPELDEATDVRVVVGNPPVGDKVTPGVQLPVRLMVLGPEGRWHEATSPHHPLGIPVDRFKVRARHADFDPDTSTLSVDRASHKLAGSRYELDVRYEGSRQLSASKKIDPDFLAAVEPMLVTHDTVSRQGQDGPPGQTGATGQPGRDGQQAITKWGRGSHATAAGDGTDGGEGGDGAPGPEIVVVAVEATTLDKKVPLVFFTVSIDGEEPTVHLARLDGPKLNVISRGGDGGPGGQGGTGGTGGTGGDGWSTGDGGDGGNGANGGPGGFGGPGGPVRLVASSARVRDHFVLRSEGGGPGPAGAAGKAGAGGESGSKLSAATAAGTAEGVGKALGTWAAGGDVADSVVDSAKNVPTPTFGEDGKNGQSGKAGEPGRRGTGGDVEAKVGDSARAIEQSVPDEMRDVIFFR